MELIDIIPEFNLYEEFWKIYTKGISSSRSIFQKRPFWTDVSSVKALKSMAKYIIL